MVNLASPRGPRLSCPCGMMHACSHDQGAPSCMLQPTDLTQLIMHRCACVVLHGAARHAHPRTGPGSAVMPIHLLSHASGAVQVWLGHRWPDACKCPCNHVNCHCAPVHWLTDGLRKWTEQYALAARTCAMLYFYPSQAPPIIHHPLCIIRFASSAFVPGS